MTGVVSALTYPSSSAMTGRIEALSLLHLCFVFRVAGDGDLNPIWEEVAREKVHTYRISKLNHMLKRGLTSYCQIFGRRMYFSAYLLLLLFVKNV